MYERYERLLNARGKKTSEVCKATGISPSTISHWKKGDYEPKKGVIQKIANYLEFPVDYFYTSSPEIFDVERRYSEPIYEVAAGQGRIASAPAEYRKEEGTFAKVVGDSMLPSLRHGDVVRIVETAEVEPEDFALVRINGDEMTVKHCEVTSDGLWVRGENPDAYTDTFYTVQQCITLPVQVIGRAVEIVSRML